MDAFSSNNLLNLQNLENHFQAVPCRLTYGAMRPMWISIAHAHTDAHALTSFFALVELRFVKPHPVEVSI